ncbi:MAG: WD40/YVTN/BNR-like repeat-containing protein [Nitrososphaerales archaeon]
MHNLIRSLTFTEGEEEIARLCIGTVGGVVLYDSAGGTRSAWEHKHTALKNSFISTLAVDYKRPGTIYAGAYHEGVFRSDDFGRNWRRASKGLDLRDVWSLALSPDSKELYAGTQPPAVFKSINGGDSWIKLESFNSMPSSRRWHWFASMGHSGGHVLVLFVDPTNSSRIYAGVEQGGLHRSDDEGATWEDIGFGLTEQRDRIDPHGFAMSPTESNTVFMADNLGVSKSLDYGSNFKGIRSGLGDWSYMSPLIIHPNLPDLLLVGGSKKPPQVWPKERNFAEGALFRSEDGGQAWKRVVVGLPSIMTSTVSALECEVVDGSTYQYLGTTSGEIYQSLDTGESWKRIISWVPSITKWGWHMMRPGGIKL